MSEKDGYLSLGSQYRKQRAKICVWRLVELPHAGCDYEVSSFYETEPVDLREQPVVLELRLCRRKHISTRFMLLRALREIETKMGSKKLVARDRAY